MLLKLGYELMCLFSSYYIFFLTMFLHELNAREVFRDMNKLITICVMDGDKLQNNKHFNTEYISYWQHWFFFLPLFQGQASPTTGKLFMLGSTNDNDPIRYGGPLLGDGPDSFSFKPLDLKSSHYTAEGKKVSSLWILYRLLLFVHFNTNDRSICIIKSIHITMQLSAISVPIPLPQV